MKWCPPDLGQLVGGLREEGVVCDFREYVKYRHYLFTRYKAEEGFDMQLFTAGIGWQ